MPSANYSGINFTVAPFSYGVQASSVAAEIQSAAFVYMQQNPLPATEIYSAAFTYMVQNPANAVYLYEPAVGFGDQTSPDAVYLSSGTTTNVVATVNYYQRVFSSGLNVWCYYTTTGGVDPSPLSTATTPNWTGSIAGYELITSSAV